MAEKFLAVLLNLDSEANPVFFVVHNKTFETEAQVERFIKKNFNALVIFYGFLPVPSKSLLKELKKEKKK